MYAADLIQKHITGRPSSLQSSTQRKPDPSQLESVHFCLERKLALLLGPPGTGKSQTIETILEEFVARNPDRKLNILIGGFSYSALAVVLQKICEATDEDGKPTKLSLANKFFLTSERRGLPEVSGHGAQQIKQLHKEKNRFILTWDGQEATLTPKRTKIEEFMDDISIFFGNAWQVLKLQDKSGDDYILSIDPIEFDIIIIDEASQVPTDHMLAFLQCVRNAKINLKYSNDRIPQFLDPFTVDHFTINNPQALQTHVILVGDPNQLPPVRQIKPPELLENHLGSVFDYYHRGMELPFRQLSTNYRSHKHIVGFTNSLDLYAPIIPADFSAKRLLKGDIEKVSIPWVKELLAPQKVVCGLIHDMPYDTRNSEFEAKMTVDIVTEYFKMMNPITKEQQRRFWMKDVGIVAPHNAHSKIIIRDVFTSLRALGLNLLDEGEFKKLLEETIFSVEKFQGSDRSLIIGTVGVSAYDQLAAEEDFIYDRNRMNVLITRAESKMIMMCSRNYLKYVPRNRDLFFDVAVPRKYMEYCQGIQNITMEFDGQLKRVEFRYKQ